MYFALSNLNLTIDSFWSMRFGLLLDLWECYRQEQGYARPTHETTIDDLIPENI